MSGIKSFHDPEATEPQKRLEVLEFSGDWNKKLGCQYYTTIRLNNPSKYMVGKQLKVMLSRRLHHIAEVACISELTLGRVSEAMAFIDAGLELPKFKTMFTKMYETKININDNTPLVFVVLKKIDC
jgi:hypothetical protein